MTRRLWMAAMFSALLTLGCGGGGDQHAGLHEGVGSGGTGSYASGPVTDFGSIVVNGIHFDERAARIHHVDRPGVALAAAAIKLGMTVEIDGSAVVPEAGREVARAYTVRIASQLLGPVDTVAGQGFQVLGQPVRVTADTHFDETLPQGVQSLASGHLVEVHGYHDVGTDSFVATRVDRPSRHTGDYVVQGVVTQVNAAQKTARIGHVLELSTRRLSAPLTEGAVMRMHVSPELDDFTSVGPWHALSADSVSPFVQARGDAHVEGLVGHIDPDDGRRFQVGGVTVDATGMDCSACAALQAGARVRVRGPLTAGQLKATAVTLLAQPL